MTTSNWRERFRERFDLMELDYSGEEKGKPTLVIPQNDAVIAFIEEVVAEERGDALRKGFDLTKQRFIEVVEEVIAKWNKDGQHFTKGVLNDLDDVLAHLQAEDQKHD